jgi:hypothetical protein
MMMAVRIRVYGVLLAATALAACGGGGGSDSSTAPTSGLANPGDIIGANPVYISQLENYLSVLRQPVFDRSNLSDLPTTGSATFSGIGRITDASVNSDDITAASLRRRSVVTDAEATVLFGARTMTATQRNFIDVDGNPVPGQVNWSGTLSPTDTGVFTATASGDVGGTIFATPTGQAAVVYLETATDSGVSGLFVNGNVTTSGWLQGSTITGDFAAN